MNITLTARVARYAALLLAAMVFVCTGVAFAAPSPSDSALTKNANPATLIEGDTAGTAFTTDRDLSHRFTTGDLYWGMAGDLNADGLKVGSDLMAAGSNITLKESRIGGDFRAAGNKLAFQTTQVDGNGSFVFDTLFFGKDCSAQGLYLGGSDLTFQGKAKYLVAYGSKIYFDGTVKGDAVLSAQEIEIGPHAKVTGTLNVRSGQNPVIPSTASIPTVNNTLDNPNAIDQVTQIRAQVAPYFQVGSTLFIVVACILMALLLLWVTGRQLEEANRVLRKHPFGHILLGLLGVVIMVGAMVICFALIFTIPAGVVLLCLLVAALLLCVPFTGASLALMGSKFPRPIRVMLGSGVASGLLFIPYVRGVVAAFSLINLIGYVMRRLFVGRTGEDDQEGGSHTGSSASTHEAEAVKSSTGQVALQAAPKAPEAPAAQRTAQLEETLPPIGDEQTPSQ